MSDESPFASAEPYYSQFRPGYGEAAIDHLRDRFSLGSGSMNQTTQVEVLSGVVDDG